MLQKSVRRDADVDKLFKTIKDATKSHVLNMGDFNLPEINWKDLEGTE